MEEKEKEDLEAMKTAVLRQKELFFDIVRDIERASAEDLKNMGYGSMTKTDAILTAYSHASKRVQKLTADYVKKYPD